MTESSGATDLKEREKQRAAEYAVARIEQDMVVGLGSGSTSAYAVKALGARVREGLRVVTVATSEETARLA